jgi:hypothetical protein
MATNPSIANPCGSAAPLPSASESLTRRIHKARSLYWTGVYQSLVRKSEPLATNAKPSLAHDVGNVPQQLPQLGLRSAHVRRESRVRLASNLYHHYFTHQPSIIRDSQTPLAFLERKLIPVGPAYLAHVRRVVHDLSFEEHDKHVGEVENRRRNVEQEADEDDDFGVGWSRFPTTSSWVQLCCSGTLMRFGDSTAPMSMA